MIADMTGLVALRSLADNPLRGLSQFPFRVLPLMIHKKRSYPGNFCFYEYTTFSPFLSINLSAIDY